MHHRVAAREVAIFGPSVREGVGYWAVVFKTLKQQGLAMFGFWEMMVYIGVVLVGFFYIWKKGVLDWAKPEKADL